jgi:hypothetical protein
MKSFFYKLCLAAVTVILVYQFTIGKEIAQIREKINIFSSSDERKKIVNSIKKEIRKANEKENYLDEEERILLKDFIKKISKELELSN